jgi:hypothetical protein
MMVRPFADLTFWLAGCSATSRGRNMCESLQTLIQVIEMTFSFALAVV